MTKRNEDLLRITAGVLIVLGSLSLGHYLEKKRLTELHKTYTACVESGMKPIQCSFKAEFGE